MAEKIVIKNLDNHQSASVALAPDFELAVQAVGALRFAHIAAMKQNPMMCLET